LTKNFFFLKKKKKKEKHPTPIIGAISGRAPLGMGVTREGWFGHLYAQIHFF
jgi:hypothetical protein